MKNKRRVWLYSASKGTNIKVPESAKAAVGTRAGQLVEAVLKPKHVQLSLEPAQFNYIVDVYTKWYGRYFYFCAKYACPPPDALEPFFETKFARLEYLGTSNRFSLSFRRHTGEWIEIYPNVSLDECLEALKEDPRFVP